MTKFIKLGMVIFYGVAIASLFVSALKPYSNTLLIILGILLIAHLIEYAVVKTKLTAVQPNTSHLLPTLLFGLFHWRPILKAG